MPWPYSCPPTHEYKEGRYVSEEDNHVKDLVIGFTASKYRRDIFNLSENPFVAKAISFASERSKSQAAAFEESNDAFLFEVW